MQANNSSDGEAPFGRMVGALAAIQRLPAPGGPRIVLWCLSALVLVMFVWSLHAKVDMVAAAEGRLVPATYAKIVQPPEAGIVKAILVHEGDLVVKDQVLVRMDPTLSGADAKSLATELSLKRLTLRRIEAELNSKELSLNSGDDAITFSQVQAQGNARRQAYLDALAQEEAQRTRIAADLRAASEVLNKLKATAPLSRQQADAYQRLVKDGFFSPLAVQDKLRDAINAEQDLKSQQATVESLEASRASQEKKIANLSSQYRSLLQTERVEALAQLARLEQDVEKTGFRTAMLELRAPQEGVIKDLATTTVGAVISQGTVLMSVVPKNEPLIAEVRIHHDDIGFVAAGQQVRMKLAAYPFQKYGFLEGVVQSVAPDVSSASNKGQDADAFGKADSGFKAVVRLNGQELKARGESLPLSAGMQLVAEVRQGERTVAEFLVSPVIAVASEAGHER